MQKSALHWHNMLNAKVNHRIGRHLPKHPKVKHTRCYLMIPTAAIAGDGSCWQNARVSTLNIRQRATAAGV